MIVPLGKTTCTLAGRKEMLGGVFSQGVAGPRPGLVCRHAAGVRARWKRAGVLAKATPWEKALR